MRAAMRGARCAGLGLVAVLAAGCWLQPGYGPARQNYNPVENGLTAANVGLLAEKWSAPLDPGVGGQPLATVNAVFTAGQVGSTFVVTATARESGALLWRRALPVVSATAHAERLLAVTDDTVLVLRVPPPGPVQVLEELDAATGATVRSGRIDNRRADPDSVVVTDDLVAFRATTLDGFGHLLVLHSRDTLGEVGFTSSFIDHVGHDGDPLVFANGQVTLMGEFATSPTAGVPSLHWITAAGCGIACQETRNTPLPLPTGASDTPTFRTLAATDDGTVLLRRSWTSSGTPHADLVAITSSGAVPYIVPLTELDGAAVAGGTVYVTGVDAATPAGSSSLLAYSGGTLVWRADVPEPLVGAPVVAGPIVYVQDGPAGGHDLRAFEAAGCGAVDCSAVALVPMPGTGSFSGFSVAFGRVYASQDGPDDRLLALAPPA